MPENCIIILNYNDGERVMKFVHQISGYSSLNRILIVDNCSTDGSFAELLLLKSDKVDVIQTRANEGYAAGNNFGVGYAMEKWGVETLFFANPDISIEEKTVPAVEKTLYAHEEYAVATALVKYGYNVWNLPAYWGTVRMLFLVAFNMHKRRIKKQMLRQGGSHDAGVVEGSFFAVRASVFKEIGGFDERTFLYMEETILSHKLHQQGYKEAVNADVFYLHEHSGSISKEYKSKANAFKLFKPGFAIYLKYYLKCGALKKAVFDLLYQAAYLERILFDILRKSGVI